MHLSLFFLISYLILMIKFFKELYGLIIFLDEHRERF
jgi:hypothetical protein